jgi:Na+/proline symporter
MRYWLTGLSLLYMLCFITAELTALSAIAGLTGKLPGHWVMGAVTLTTLLYTSWGGLRASMATDRLQGWLILGLIVAVCVSIAWATYDLQTPLAAPPSIPLASGLSVAITLIIAVTAANLFHQGYWQRIWSARDDNALKTGSLWAAIITVIIIAVIGSLGMLTVMLGKDPGQPPAPFFVLIGGTSPWLAAIVMVLATALVASSIDSLQNALASLLVTFRQQTGGTSIRQARWLTVLLMIPVFLVALEGISVLRIFLVADLLCATAVIPVLLGFWKRMTPLSAIAGCTAGLIGSVVPGWIETGDWMTGLLLASFPNNTPTLGPFAGALLGSSIATLLVAYGSSPAKRAH